MRAMVSLACAFIVLANAAPTSAAPDGTLGMSLMSAMISANGSIAAGAGVLDAAKLSTGFYNVTFKRTLSGCTFVGSISTTTDTVPTGTLIMTREPSDLRILNVATFSDFKTSADRDFGVMVFCVR
jgi:hypothetical protein